MGKRGITTVRLLGWLFNLLSRKVIYTKGEGVCPKNAVIDEVAIVVGFLAARISGLFRKWYAKTLWFCAAVHSVCFCWASQRRECAPQVVQ